MIRGRVCVCILCAVLAAAIAAALLFAPVHATAQDAAARPLSFIGDIAPILKEHCLACHDSKKPGGKLDMTTFARLRQGGSNEDPIVSGKPTESLLIERLKAEGRKRMPPPPADRPEDPSGAIPIEKVALIERWITEGAQLDSGLPPDANVLRELRQRWRPPPPAAAYARPVPVTALAFTPGGQKLIVGGRHELMVWNAADGKLLARVATRAERTHALAFLGNDLVVAAGGRPGEEGDVRVYNLAATSATVENGIARLNGIDDPAVLVAHLIDIDDCMLCLVVSGDGKKLAAGGCDRVVRVWDVSGGAAAAKLEQTIDVHTDWVLGLAFSPDGKRLMTASRDKTAKVWDLEKRESMQSYGEHQQTIHGIAVRADGQAGLSVGADKMLRIWNADGSAKSIKAVGGHTDEVLRIVAVPGQPQFATSSADASVRLWSADGAPVRTYGGLTDHVFALAVSPDGTRVAAGDWTGQIRIWKLADAALIVGFPAFPNRDPNRAAAR
jgi:hypothetical protein